MMDYADSELLDRTTEQYTDTLSPPLFLVLTIILSHGLELAIVGQSEMVADTRGLSALISDDTNPIIFRAISFSLFPLMMALRLLRRQRRKLDRDTMRPPFYSQCYVTAPFALVTGVVSLMLRNTNQWVVLGAAALMLVTIIWYLVLQTGWFAQHLGVSKLRAFPTAFGAYLIALLLLAAMAPLFR